MGRRHTRGRGCFDSGVAVAAIESEPADVMLVTERHRGSKRSCVRTAKCSKH